MDSGSPDTIGLRLPNQEEFASALSHPVAAQALKMMRRRPATAAEVAEVVGEPLEEVSRHLADLRQRGLIYVEGSREVNGRSEIVYSGPFVPFLDKEEWEELDPEDREFQLLQIIRLLLADLSEALEAGTLDAWPDFHLCRTSFRMDEQGWEEVRELYDSALMTSIRAREDAAKRLEQRGERGKRGTLGHWLFELPDID